MAVSFGQSHEEVSAFIIDRLVRRDGQLACISKSSVFQEA